ncbi:hypothetical protein DEI82_06965 [Curtobacterium sp. MCBD17_019]|nr:hypothetical protein DEI82_06965 [Curtobacterium sp. MCBD17_019]
MRTAGRTPRQAHDRFRHPDRVRPRLRPRPADNQELVLVLDVFVVLGTVALFGVIALIGKGVERL